MYGVLLDGFPSHRDHIGNKVVISHSGGQTAEIDGQRVLTADQMPDGTATIRAFVKNVLNRNPVMLTIGKFPPNPLHSAEPSDGVKRKHQSCYWRQDPSQVLHHGSLQGDPLVGRA